MKEPLKVLLWNKEIGRLVWDNKTHNTYFTYNPEFLKTGLEIAPFTAPIKGARSRFPVYGEDDKKYQKLPVFLSDPLPDDRGNQLFEHWILYKDAKNKEEARKGILTKEEYKKLQKEIN